MIYHTDIPLQQQPDCFDFSIDISDRLHLHAFFMLDLGWQVCVQRIIAAHCKVSGGGETVPCLSLTHCARSFLRSSHVCFTLPRSASSYMYSYMRSG